MTIKYIFNVGLREGCSTDLEKQTRGRRRRLRDPETQRLSMVKRGWRRRRSCLSMMTQESKALPVLFVIFSRYILQWSPEKFGMLVEVKFLYVYWII